MRHIGIRPFFSYFGSKWMSALGYPPPIYRRIVEPFAGGAGYSHRYPDRDVLLVERDPVVASVWRWLLTVTSDALLSLPEPRGATLDEPRFAKLSAAERAFIGFHLGAGEVRPRRRWSSWWARNNRGWSPELRAALAGQLDRIRHWRIVEGDYTTALELVTGPATWFVDPPYSSPAGRKYRGGRPDYAALAAWVQSLNGQVIVCEAAGAPMSQKSCRRAVLSRARIAARPGRRVQCYDSEATSCGCTVGCFLGIPAAPVEVERERRPGERRCLVCGTSWRVGEDLWTPVPEVLA